LSSGECLSNFGITDNEHTCAHGRSSPICLVGRSSELAPIEVRHLVDRNGPHNRHAESVRAEVAWEHRSGLRMARTMTALRPRHTAAWGGRTFSPAFDSPR